MYAESEDLINIGAYVNGSNPIIDRSIKLNQPINKFLKQNVAEHYSYDETVERLKETMES